MSLLKKGACKHCTYAGWAIGLLLLLTTLAALVGVYKSHFVSGGATFGTTTGSLSLLAFAVNVTLWSKVMKGCCGCEK